jgi:hypothetical protein
MRIEAEGSVRPKSLSDNPQHLALEDSLKQPVAPSTPGACGTCNFMEDPVKKVPTPEMTVPSTETIAPELRNMTPQSTPALGF